MNDVSEGPFRVCMEKKQTCSFILVVRLILSFLIQTCLSVFSAAVDRDLLLPTSSLSAINDPVFFVVLHCVSFVLSVDICMVAYPT